MFLHSLIVYAIQWHATQSTSPACPFPAQMLEYMSRLAMTGIQETEHTRVNKPYTTISIDCKSQDIAYELFAGQGTLVTHNKRCIIRTFTTEEMLLWLPLPEEVEIEVRACGERCVGRALHWLPIPENV